MPDGTVGVRQADVPDRLIDNDALSVSGQTVYRQRVSSYQPVEEIRFDYDSSRRVVYLGKNANGVATSAATWTVQKFTYGTTDGNPDRIQILTGSWDGRATLPW